MSNWVYLIEDIIDGHISHSINYNAYIYTIASKIDYKRDAVIMLANQWLPGVSMHNYMLF